MSMISSQGRSNPFKVSSEKSSAQNGTASKGTSFFEKLESKSLPKIKSGICGDFIYRNRLFSMEQAVDFKVIE